MSSDAGGEVAVPVWDWPVRLFHWSLVVLLVATFTAVSQSLPSATLSGKVSSDGQGLPGVTVTAKSPGLQGTRTSTTSVNGGYVFANLPPGEYTITFMISGFQPATRTIRLAASQSQVLDATMSLSKVESTAVVTATAETISESPSAQTTYAKDLTAEQIDQLVAYLMSMK